MTALITAARLRELFSYDPDTGVFRRLFQMGPHRAGEVRARVNSKGYYRIAIDGRSYLMHRLAWLYVHGVFPPDLLDHRDGVKTNNRITNLRPCTYMQNVQNVSGKARGKSGFKGVFKSTHGHRYEARIGVNYKEISLGYFKTPEAAHQAYLDAKRKHHTFAPEFTR